MDMGLESARWRPVLVTGDSDTGEDTTAEENVGSWGRGFDCGGCTGDGDGLADEVFGGPPKVDINDRTGPKGVSYYQAGIVMVHTSGATHDEMCKVPQSLYLPLVSTAQNERGEWMERAKVVKSMRTIVSWLELSYSFTSSCYCCCADNLKSAITHMQFNE